jgi:hypothetical protein
MPVGGPAARGGAPVRKKASWPPLFVLLLVIGGAIGALMTLVTHRPEPAATPASVSVPHAVGNALQQFDSDAYVNLAMAQASVTRGLVSPSQLDTRLAYVKMRRDEVLNLRERLDAAMRQARLEDHWPLRVAGVTFDRPSQLQKAIDSADAYLQRGARVEKDLVSASDQVRHTQAAAERTLAQMQQIRTDVHLMAVGQSPLDTAAVQEKRARFAELNADLTQILRSAPPVDWKKFDLPPFQLNH